MYAGRRQPRRGRGAAATALLLVLGLTSSACGMVTGRGDGDTIQVVVLWTGAELDQFVQLVEAYQTDHEAGDDQVTVQVISVGEDIDGFIRARHDAGSPPDVAILPQPALIDAYADEEWLLPLDGTETRNDLSDRYPTFWRDLGEAPDGTFYGAWITLANKSLITDWFENLLAAYDGAPPTTPEPDRRGASPDTADCAVDPLDPDDPDDTDPVYDQLASGLDRWNSPPVEGALCTLAQLWGGQGTFPEPGADRALLTQFDESLIQVIGTGEAALLLMGDFAYTLTSDHRTDDDTAAVPLAPFHLPSPTDQTPMIVSGDAAVVFADSEHGAALVDWLTDLDTWWEEAEGSGDPVLTEPFDTPLTSLGYTSPLLGAYDEGREAFCPASAPDTCTVAWFVGSCTSRVLDGEPCLVDDDTPALNARFDLSDQLPLECRRVLEGALQDFLVGVTRSEARQARINAFITTMSDATAGEGDPCHPT